MIFCILGKTAAGKDTFVSTLIANINNNSNIYFRKVVSYTTRPKRANEINGLSYNFISEDDFIDMLNANVILGARSYNTVHGKWYYGMPLIKKDINICHLCIVDISGYKFIKDFYGNDFAVYGYYLDVDEETQRKRLLNRGDDPNEIERRIKADNEAFKELENYDLEDLQTEIGKDFNIKIIKEKI